MQNRRLKGLIEAYTIKEKEASDNVAELHKQKDSEASKEQKAILREKLIGSMQLRDAYLNFINHLKELLPAKADN